MAEPALQSAADRASKKLFTSALRSFRRRDFSGALDLFSEAERRHRAAGGDRDDFIFGCLYYTGRCLESMFNFDAARDNYVKIPQASAYRDRVDQRLSALTEDSDNDGYLDAWEDAEGTSPQNPLSHP